MPSFRGPHRGAGFRVSGAGLILLALDEHPSRDAVLTAVARDMYGRGETRRRLIEPPFHLESHRYQTVQVADWIARSWAAWGHSGRNRRRGWRTRCSDATSRIHLPPCRSDAAFEADGPGLDGLCRANPRNRVGRPSGLEPAEVVGGDVYEE